MQHQILFRDYRTNMRFGTIQTNFLKTEVLLKQRISPCGLDLLNRCRSYCCFFSPYRRWLGFMLAGMLSWGLLEVVRFGM